MSVAYLELQGGMKAHVESYGAKGWVALVVGHVSNYDGPTRVVALRRERTTEAQAAALLQNTTPEAMRAMLDERERLAVLNMTERTQAQRDRATLPELPPLPDWTLPNERANT